MNTANCLKDTILASKQEQLASTSCPHNCLAAHPHALWHHTCRLQTICDRQGTVCIDLRTLDMPCLSSHPCAIWCVQLAPATCAVCFQLCSTHLMAMCPLTHCGANAVVLCLCSVRDCPRKRLRRLGLSSSASRPASLVHLQLAAVRTSGAALSELVRMERGGSGAAGLRILARAPF